jgi:prepilin-type N-terminal cleavage/methylation domain-containing protein
MRHSRAGFTLIELLVVIAVSAFLTTLVVAYSSTSRNQVSLSVQTTALAGLLARAKSLSVATYQNPAGGAIHICAYGVSFDLAGGTYSLVAYGVAAGLSCPDAATLGASGVPGDALHEYDVSTWQTPLANGLKFETTGASGDALALVLFYPPDPATLVSRSVCTPGDGDCTYQFIPPPGAIYLVTTDGSAQQTIAVGAAGQIGW